MHDRTTRAHSSRARDRLTYTNRRRDQHTHPRAHFNTDGYTDFNADADTDTPSIDNRFNAAAQLSGQRHDT